MCFDIRVVTCGPNEALVISGKRTLRNLMLKVIDTLVGILKVRTNTLKKHESFYKLWSKCFHEYF